MLHRVIGRSDARWMTCDPEYSISDEALIYALEFFREHYSIVSLDDVLAARRGSHVLPERALLITFDDGWADTEEYALAALREARMPAVVFVVSDAVGRRDPFFQEQLIGAYRTRRLDSDVWRALWRSSAANDDGEPAWSRQPHDLEALRRLIARLEALDAERRAAVLAPHADALAVSLPHMLTREQMRRLAEGGVAIGSHGRTHTPIPRAANPTAELADSRHALGTLLGAPPPSLSFPHGRYDASTLAAARATGYELMFTSDHIINALPSGRPSDVLGRINITTGCMTDSTGRFRPDLLALRLFRAPVARA